MLYHAILCASTVTQPQGIIVGNVLGVLLGRFVDKFRNHKLVLVTLNAGAAAAIVYFSLVTSKALPTVLTSGNAAFWAICVTATITGGFLNAAVPIFFESSIEETHPAPESTVLSLLTFVYNLGSLVMLFVPVSNDTVLFNWMFAGTVLALTVALLVWYFPASKRWDVDAVDDIRSAVHDVSDSEEGEDKGAWDLGGAKGGSLISTSTGMSADGRESISRSLLR